MIDAIIYISDLPTLVSYLDIESPHMLARDEDGAMTLPPSIVGFDRTPAVINGDSALAYMRLSDEQYAQWRDTPGVEILAEAPYQGGGTGDAAYNALFTDIDATSKYDSVYDRTPRDVDDGEGGTITVTPPDRFGVMAGA